MSNQLQNLELRSEEVQEILNKVPNWMIRWGNMLFLLLIVGLLAITWFVKYPDIITSQVIVTTKIPPQKIYAKTTGKLDTILLVDNQLVKSNQAIAIIENTANFTDIYYLKSIIDTLSIQRQDFYFPFSELPILFLGELEADFALFENAYVSYTLNKELKPFSNEAKANKTSVLELERRLQNTESQKELFELELNFKKKELERHKILYEKGVISAQEYESKQQALLRLQRNYENSSLSGSQIREAISIAKKISRGTEINKTREEIVLLKNVIQSYNQLRKRIKEWELSYVLKSDITGRVSFLSYWSKNQFVNQGDLVFSIIPSENSAFIGKLKTATHNSGKIKLGQTVNIKLQNYPEEEFGVLKGIITNISLMPNEEGYYILDVSLSDKLITSYNKELVFKQEMNGKAEIITEDLRLIERFFYQFRNLFKR